MTNLQKIVEKIFTPEELALVDSGEYRPGRAVLDAKIDLAIAAEREQCAKVCEENLRDEYLRQTRPIQEEVMLLAAIADCAAAIRARGESE